MPCVVPAVSPRSHIGPPGLLLCLPAEAPQPCAFRWKNTMALKVIYAGLHRGGAMHSPFTHTKLMLCAHEQDCITIAIESAIRLTHPLYIETYVDVPGNAPP